MSSSKAKVSVAAGGLKKKGKKEAAEDVEGTLDRLKQQAEMKECQRLKSLAFDRHLVGKKRFVPEDLPAHAAASVKGQFMA